MSNDMPRKGIGSQEEMWVLSLDRRSLRMELPPLPIDGLPESLRLSLEFDVGAVDQILQRLSELRAQMLPSLGGKLTDSDRHPERP
jgi:hypothetical protein